MPVDRVQEEKALDLVRNLCVSVGHQGESGTGLTSSGDRNPPHSTTNFSYAEYGPHFSVFLSLPNVLSSLYDNPISASSDCGASPRGMSSADGMASMKLEVSGSSATIFR